MPVKKINKVTKIFTGAVLLFPVMTIYATSIPAVTFGEVILAVLMVILCIDILWSKKTLKISSNPFWLYLLYAFGISLISSIVLALISTQFSLSEMLQRVIRDGFYFILILIFGEYYFDFEYAKKFIKIFSVISGCYIILQFMVYAIWQIYIPGIIPQLQTSISGGVTGEELIQRYTLIASYDGHISASAFFSEPAVVAHYITVALLLELFTDKGKGNLKLAVFYSLIMLLSFSLNAYISICVCWGLWALYSARNKKYAYRTLVFAIAFLVAGLFLVNSTNVMNVFNRLVYLLSGEQTSGSSVIRVLRGPAFYFKMPLLFQLFGSGFGNFMQFKEIFGITTIYETADEYMNTNAYILVSSGVMGFVLFVVTLAKKISKKIVFSKMLFVLVLMFGLSSSIYSSAQFVIMMMFMIYAPEKREV